MKPADHRRPLLEALEPRQLLSAGQLDPTFGDRGKVLTDLGLSYGTGVAIQTDGKIVASARDDHDSGFHLVRYNGDGTLDTSFGVGGVVTTDTARHVFDNIESVILQPDGKILLGGTRQVETRSTLRLFTVVARYNADGSVDTSFADHGVLELPGDLYQLDGSTHGTFSPGPVIMATQSDGKLLLTQILGDDYTTTGANLSLYRFDANGRLDATFGSNGKSLIDLGLIERPRDIAIQADGKIVLSIDGHIVLTQNGSTSWPSYNTYLVRLNADGTRDTGFGEGGVVTEHVTSGQINATKLVIGLDGKILLLGENMATDRSIGAFVIGYNVDGTRDGTFGDNGEVIPNPGPSGNYADLLVQPDGKLLLTGGTPAGRNGDQVILSQRLNQDGSPDTTYGTGGSTWVTVGTQFDTGTQAALQQDGGIVIVGYSHKYGLSPDPKDNIDLALIRLEGGPGAAGSRHASLRRGHDQQAQYNGRSVKRAALDRTKSHRSPKRIAMEQAAKHRHRSPKQIALEQARQQAASLFAGNESKMNQTIFGSD
jgi:uncharacterized delta-60 repeat protein